MLLGLGCLLVLAGSTAGSLGFLAVLELFGPGASEADPGWVWVLMASAVLPTAAGVLTIAGGLLGRLIARNGREAVLGWFDRAPRLGWLLRYGVKLVWAGLATALVGLAVFGAGLLIEYLLSGGYLPDEEDPAMGLVPGLVVLAVALSAFLVGVGGAVLGLAMICVLWLGYLVRLVLDPSVPRDEVAAYALVVGGVLIVAGVFAVVASGTGGAPADNRLARGLITTVGAVLIVLPAGGAMVWAWRAGFRPWGTKGDSTGRVAMLAVIAVQAVACAVLVAWLVRALVHAWGS